MFSFLCAVTLFPLLSGSTNHYVDVNRTLVWGPGLTPEKVVLPARYFFIHAVDSSGKRYTSTPDKGFVIQIKGSSEIGVCRVWHQILNRKDGSFIVRYRMYHTCSDMSIHIKHDGKHVAGSPYQAKGPVYGEDCYCPVNEMDDWLSAMQCPSQYSQIKDDLQSFHSINMNESLNLAIERYARHPGSHSICHYLVKGNAIYRKCFGEHVGFNMFMDAILLSLTRKVILPDMELIVNLGDWPLAKNDVKPFVPIFSWCGSKDTKDIVMPTYDLTESTLQTMGRTTLDMLAVMGSSEVAWREKIEKGFWRGRDSRRERLDLVRLSREHPHLINASLTNMFFFRDQLDQYGPLVKHVSFFKFFDYKYQISVDGTVSAYRFPYLLAGDSLVLKQDSEYYEHFYQDLKPWEHFVPVKRDLSNLIDQLTWAKNHDQEAKRISLTSRFYAENNLLATNVFCYHGVLFKEWASRISSPSSVVIQEGYEHVPQPQPEQGYVDCGCHRNKLVKGGSVKEEL